MDGPRGSLVIGLLFLIAGQLAFIAAALTGGTGFSLLGLVMMVFFVLAVVRVLVELFRQGAEEQRAEEQRKRSDADARRSRRAQRHGERERSTATDPVTPTAMRDAGSATSTAIFDPDGGVSALDPEKRRPPHS